MYEYKRHDDQDKDIVQGIRYRNVRGMTIESWIFSKVVDVGMKWESIKG